MQTQQPTGMRRKGWRNFYENGNSRFAFSSLKFTNFFSIAMRTRSSSSSRPLSSKMKLKSMSNVVSIECFLGVFVVGRRQWLELQITNLLNVSISETQIHQISPVNKLKSCKSKPRPRRGGKKTVFVFTKKKRKKIRKSNFEAFKIKMF